MTQVSMYFCPRKKRLSPESDCSHVAAPARHRLRLLVDAGGYVRARAGAVGSVGAAVVLRALRVEHGSDGDSTGGSAGASLTIR